MEWILVFFFKQKTAYEMRISDWSSDVCSSDLRYGDVTRGAQQAERHDGNGEGDQQGQRQTLDEEAEHACPLRCLRLAWGRPCTAPTEPCVRYFQPAWAKCGISSEVGVKLRSDV